MKEPDFHCDHDGICNAFSDQCCWQNCPNEDFRTFPYTDEGLLRSTYNSQWPILECNNECACEVTAICRNTQFDPCRRRNGHTLEIFFTDNGKGYGVRTEHAIASGTYVCDFIGEIITKAKFSRLRRHYGFRLDKFGGKDNRYVIDATRYGNVAKFFNHSCNPNLLPMSVCNGADLSMYRVCFFAKRDILPNEELTFRYLLPYQPSEDPDRFIAAIRCRCDSENCQGAMMDMNQ